ncbi:hypothetical protein FKM82_004621 [Ascaphus truei]
MVGFGLSALTCCACVHCKQWSTTLKTCPHFPMASSFPFKGVYLTPLLEWTMFQKHWGTKKETNVKLT